MEKNLTILTMKNTQIFIFILVVSVLFAGMSIRKTETMAVKRGKVVADDRSSIFDLKLNEASIFSIQQTSDSVEIKGKVCVLGSDDKPTGTLIKMKTRNFPKWFIADCKTGSFVDYRIVAEGTRNEMAIVTRIYPKP